MRTPVNFACCGFFKTDQIVAAIQPEDYWMTNGIGNLKIMLTCWISPLLMEQTMQLRYKTESCFKRSS